LTWKNDSIIEVGSEAHVINLALPESQILKIRGTPLPKTGLQCSQRLQLYDYAQN